MLKTMSSHSFDNAQNTTTLLKHLFSMLYLKISVHLLNLLIRLIICNLHNRIKYLSKIAAASKLLNIIIQSVSLYTEKLPMAIKRYLLG